MIKEAGELPDPRQTWKELAKYTDIPYRLHDAVRAVYRCCCDDLPQKEFDWRDLNEFEGPERPVPDLAPLWGGEFYYYMWRLYEDAVQIDRYRERIESGESSLNFLWQFRANVEWMEELACVVLRRLSVIKRDLSFAAISLHCVRDKPVTYWLCRVETKQYRSDDSSNMRRRIRRKMQSLLDSEAVPYVQVFAREYSRIRSALYRYKAIIEALIVHQTKEIEDLIAFYGYVVGLQRTLLSLGKSALQACQAVMALTDIALSD